MERFREFPDTADSAQSSDSSPLAEAYRKKLAHCTAIPSMPAAAVRAIEIGNDPECGLSDIVDAVHADVGLSAKLLMAANSPVYGMRRKVSNLNQAASLMGLDACMVLILSFSLSGALRRSPGDGIDMKRYWLRSLACAVAGKALAMHNGVINTDHVFLVSLLQDIGVVAFERIEPARYIPLHAKAKRHADLVRAELETFGVEHASIGQWLLAEWHFPQWIIDAVGTSHTPNPDRELNYVSAASEFAEIFVGEDRDGAIERATAYASRLIGMDETSLVEALETMHAMMPEYAAMFEVQLPDTDDELVEHARHLLLMRSMRLCTDAEQSRQLASEYMDQMQKLEDKARKDPLTATFNRAYLDDFLSDNFDKATSQNWPLSIAFIDFDRFKQLNDEHGHQFGDTVLAEGCAALLGSIRQSDLLARYGGEEFMLVMPGADMACAKQTAERLQKLFRDHIFVTDAGDPVDVTFSVGLATHMDKERFESVRSLVRAADDAVYEAKKQGRDRIVSHA